MLLTTVIIILQEVLEAAVLIGLLLALTRSLELGYRWFGAALLLGVLGAALYGLQLTPISNALDGVGQEVLNALIQFAIYGLLLIVAASLLPLRPEPGQRRLLTFVMTVVVALAILREGSEIYVYLLSFRYRPEPLAAVTTGSLIGAGIGFSVGALFYYGLLSLSPKRRQLAICVLLALIGAGLCLQASQLLVQADWLPAQYPLWDTSSLLPESAIAGRVLYAVAGYEATPTALQVVIYVAALVTMALTMGITGARRASKTASPA